MLGKDDVTEVDYVEECPDCGIRFLGMTPEEVREKHSRECPSVNAPLLRISVWPDGKSRK